MANIKPAEVSKILKQQLEGIQTGVELEEVGTVLQVGDGIARIYGLSNAQSNELIEFENGIEAIVLNLEEDNIGAVLLGPTEEINEGDIVKRTGRIASLGVGEGLLGRVITPTGQPLDGKGPITGELFNLPFERKAPGVIFRQPVRQPLQTGIKAIDAMIPIGADKGNLLSATDRPVKQQLQLILLLISEAILKKGNRFIAFMLQSDKKVQLLQILQQHLKNMVHLNILLLYLLQLLILLHHSSMLLLPELQSENFSAIRVVMPLLFMMTFQNRQYLTGKFLFCFVVHQDVKHIPVMFSICTQDFLKEQQKSLNQMKLHKR